MTQPAVRVRGLGRRFGRRWALRGVDLELESGAVVAVVGPNGAGKTTLLKVLATLLRPTTGEVEVLGHPVRTEADAIRRRAGFLPASGFLYDDLTAMENLRFSALMSGGATKRSVLHEALERVALADVADLRLRGFSTGMRKRLELARLFLRRTELVLLDEPFASLDTAGVDLVVDHVAELRDSGCTVLFATHRRTGVARLADRVAEMADGRLHRLGRPEEWS